jgi:protoporphyrinogen oxidase
LARNAGIREDEIVPCSPVASTLRNGRMIDIDTSRLTSLLFTPLLSWGAKLRVAWGLYKHKKLLKSANAFSLTDLAWFDDPATNAEEFSVKAFGREAADYLIDPLMRTIGGTHMSKVSALAALGGLSSFTAEMVTVLGGLARVTDGIAAKLNVTYNARVTSIVETAGGVMIDGALTADACVIATQYDDAERLWPRLKEYAGDYGKHLTFCRLMDVKLGYSAATHSKAYAAQVPTIENDQVLMFALSHNKAPDRAPAGSSLFTVYTEHTKYDWFAAMSNDEIIEWGRRQMEALYPEIAGHFVFGLVTRQPKTVCFADPGFYRRTAALIESIPKHSRVQLAGDVFGAGSMEAAVVWGERAADRVLGNERMEDQ